MEVMHSLRQIDLFRDLTEAEFDHLQDIMHVLHVSRGECIFVEGQKRTAIYFVERGLVKISRVDIEGREHIVNLLGVQSLFPHVGFFDSGPYPGTAEAVVDCTLFAMSIAMFEELLLQHPGMMQKMLRVLGNMIIQLQSKLQQLAVFGARERVLTLILHFIEEHGRVELDGVHVHLPVTHAEIANMVALSRESVSRIWKDLRREGIVKGHKEEWIFDLQWYKSLLHSQ
ncbi:Crp/Fnr family transcriptional regulator [Sulfoacidibacillus thermotolerans]|uniref:Crp/Fnr family transcriptional regulator n=1 Tax=Sulfoacidibacillus thermotolerans TaxID=1765684 RepID=A0A2U3D759_SULT2|nr:Crp/Fnr family transcriptional regulator [Sulfoacidibacillus thermotolerans]PWI57107.1 Crp/Fnr family transcriptional regulator [Sulfoacidibacillus thermotolerans]